jgi:hypothetical protein
MGSVQGEIKCPNCDYEGAIEDCYWKWGEVYISCSRCGYFEHYCPSMQWKENEPVHPEIYDKVIPYAALMIYFTSVGQHSTAPTKEGLDEFIAAFYRGEFVNGKGEKAILVGHSMKDPATGNFMFCDLTQNKVYPFEQFRDELERIKKEAEKNDN